jgi:hypothetical protein
MQKANSDHSDIRFIIDWLAEQHMFISFNHYQGKSKADLLPLLRKYYNRYEDAEFIGQLKRIVQSEDWEQMMGLAV